MIRPAVYRAISTLTNLKTTNQPLDKLQADIDSFTNISDDLKLCNDTGKQLETLLGKYVNALTSNIKDRLGSSPDVIEAFAIFDLLLLPVTMTVSGNTVRVKLQFLPTISFQGMKTRRGSCFASGHRSSFSIWKTLSSTIWNPKHHLLLVISVKEQRYFSSLNVPRDLVRG